MRLPTLVTFALCWSLLAACGDNHASDDPCAEAPSGTACTWLGVPGEVGFNGDGHHRLDTTIQWSMNMLFHSDGTVWFIDWNNHLLRRVLTDDTVETMVGWTDPIWPGDGVPDHLDAELTPEGAPGLEVRLNHPTDLVEDGNGDVLLMAWHNHKLRRIESDSGRSHIVCGAGAGYRGDGGPVSEALFKQPFALVRDEVGNLFIADQQNQRVRMIDTAGIITTIAGDGIQGFGGDGGPALEAMLDWEIGSNPEPSGGLALAGSMLYVSDTMNHRIRVVDLDSGVIDTLAGSGEEGFGGDGGPALEAKLDKPHDLEIGPEGDLYVADTNNNRIRAIDLTTGIIRTVVGAGPLGLDDVDGLPATETLLARPFGIDFDPEGNLYVQDTINSRILKVAR